jgi:hypothetical protein
VTPQKFNVFSKAYHQQGAGLQGEACRIKTIGWQGSWKLEPFPGMAVEWRKQSRAILRAADRLVFSSLSISPARVRLFAIMFFQQHGRVCFWLCFSTGTRFQQLSGFVFGFVWVCFLDAIICYQ